MLQNKIVKYKRREQSLFVFLFLFCFKWSTFRIFDIAVFHVTELSTAPLAVFYKQQIAHFEDCKSLCHERLQDEQSVQNERGGRLRSRLCYRSGPTPNRFTRLMHAYISKFFSAQDASWSFMKPHQGVTCNIMWHNVCLSLIFRYQSRSHCIIFYFFKNPSNIVRLQVFELDFKYYFGWFVVSFSNEKVSKGSARMLLLG